MLHTAWRAARAPRARACAPTARCDGPQRVALPHRRGATAARLPPAAAAVGDQGGADAAGPAPAQQPEELPEELRDLAISEDGFLIDTKTGKVVNEMGATRFDVAVRALRGELDPPQWVENSERSPGVLLAALYQFPKPYIFQVVGRPAATPDAPGSAGAAGPSSSGGGAAAKEAFVRDVAAVIGRVCQAEVGLGDCEVKDRMGGKYVSVAVEVTVRAPEIVAAVYDELGKDSRVMMRF